MDDFGTALLTALGLVLVLEGLFYALGAEAMQRAMRMLQEIDPATLRRAGLAAVAVGVLIVWLARSSG